jgi:uncharacterized membrane protein (UPF0127 family)
VKKFLTLIIVAFFMTGCEFLPGNFSHSKNIVRVGDQTFFVEVADTSEARSIGLMHRKKLSPDAGMLFVFDTPGQHQFWMKNTLIPLDVIWISPEKKIIDVQTLHPCESDPCPSFGPSDDSKWVLEVGAGQFAGAVGDAVEFDFE